MPVNFLSLFVRPKPVIAMVHTGPSPGMPGFVSIEAMVDRALEETDIYLSAGVDGILVENMHDFPPIHEREMGPEVAAYMTRVAREVKQRALSIPVGIQVLFQANRTALAVALAAGCDFIRAEGWTYAHVSDKGVAEASAGSVVRYRYVIGAAHIPILADIKKKHASHAWTADLSAADVARGMDLHGADGVIVTGSHTGEVPDAGDVRRIRASTTLPVIVGSGATPQNLGALVPLADGFIVGSALKEGGAWNAGVSRERVAEFMAVAGEVRMSYR